MIDLKQRREATGMTQAEFARRCGYTPAYLCMVEKGRIQPSPKLQNMIQKVLDGKIIGGSPSRKDYIPEIPFASEEEKEGFHGAFCRRYGSSIKRREELQDGYKLA